MNITKRIIGFIKRVYSKNKLVKVHCNKQWFGNSYGGFYVCPDLLNESAIVYSFGIGEDISFDNAILDKFKCKVFGFDPTPKSITWISSQILPKGFNFFPYGIDSVSGSAEFFLPKNPDFVSGSIIANPNLLETEKIKVKMKSLASIAEELNHNKIDVLKMDIEGSEFRILESIFTSNVFIGQILIEFHDRFFDDGKKRIADAFKILKENGFEVFAVSDSLEEISFININHLRSI